MCAYLALLFDLGHRVALAKIKEEGAVADRLNVTEDARVAWILEDIHHIREGKLE